MGDKNWTFNVSDGGQVNVANDNSMISVTQNNGVSAGELDAIIKGIKDSLSDLKEDDAEGIRDVVDMVKEELEKPEPKVSRLQSCVTLIAPMFTIVNGIPALASNLQRLVAYIKPYIQ